jgi:hypothetical protein
VSTCYVCRGEIEAQDQGRDVVLRNGFIAPACLRYWFIWPDEHKRYPAFGYGRTGETPSEHELVQLLRETAP